MKEVEARICRLVPEENSREEAEKITVEVVKSAAVKMKPHKMDISQGFTRDRFLNALSLLTSR